MQQPIGGSAPQGPEHLKLPHGVADSPAEIENDFCSPQHGFPPTTLSSNADAVVQPAEIRRLEWAGPQRVRPISPRSFPWADGPRLTAQTGFPMACCTDSRARTRRRRSRTTDAECLPVGSVAGGNHQALPAGCPGGGMLPKTRRIGQARGSTLSGPQLRSRPAVSAAASIGLPGAGVHADQHGPLGRSTWPAKVSTTAAQGQPAGGDQSVPDRNHDGHRCRNRGGRTLGGLDGKGTPAPSSGHLRWAAGYALRAGHQAAAHQFQAWPREQAPNPPRPAGLWSGADSAAATTSPFSGQPTTAHESRAAAGHSSRRPKGG